MWLKASQSGILELGCSGQKHTKLMFDFLEIIWKHRHTVHDSWTNISLFPRLYCLVFVPIHFAAAYLCAWMSHYYITCLFHSPKREWFSQQHHKQMHKFILYHDRTSTAASEDVLWGWTSSSSWGDRQLLLRQTNKKMRERSHFQIATTALYTHTPLEAKSTVVQSLIQILQAESICESYIYIFFEIRRVNFIHYSACDLLWEILE